MSSLRLNRRRSVHLCSMMGAAAVCLASPTWAEEVTELVGPANGPSEVLSSDVEASADEDLPSASTEQINPAPIDAAANPDERLAKRPWLLEKLSGKKEPAPSIKMDPPQPPAGAREIPSLDRISPPSSDPPPASSGQAKLKSVTVEPLGEGGRDQASSRSGEVRSSEASPTKSDGENQSDEVTDSGEPSPKGSSRITDLVDVDYTGFPKQPIRLTRSVYQMRRPMQQCLRSYHSDIEVANRRSNWGMMHAMMVYGADTRLRVGGRSLNTIAWIAGNNACRGQKLFDQDEYGFFARSGVGLQGHQGQLLAVLGMCGVPAEYPLYAGKQKFSVGQLIEREQLDCAPGKELTFTLIALSHYLDTESVWYDRDGEAWDFERLIREELAQPIVGAACGGTHRLMGFAHALRKRRAEGYPITGQWARAEKFARDFVDYTYRLQNRDGSMSTDWFEGREDNGDLDRKLQTTGHMVEWLLTITPDSGLQNPRLVSAVRFLLNSLNGDRDREWSIGPKGHALRSLALYYERVYQSEKPWRTSHSVAKTDGKPLATTNRQSTTNRNQKSGHRTTRRHATRRTR